MNTAIQLLHINGETRVDSRILAKGIGIEHHNIMQTIYTYQSELEEFNQLLFETEVGRRPQGGGNPEKYVALNRNQAGVVISFSKNTPEVIRFKVDLFKAIDAMEQNIASQLVAQPAQSKELERLRKDIREIKQLISAPEKQPVSRKELKERVLEAIRDMQEDYPDGVTTSEINEGYPWFSQRSYSNTQLWHIVEKLVEQGQLQKNQIKKEITPHYFSRFWYYSVPAS